MARRRAKTAAVRPLILDSGAVLALARGHHRAQVFLEQTLELKAPVVAPPVVVAETARGDEPRDATVNRVLNAVVVLPTTEAKARLAGRLLAQAGSSETVDALVAAEAIAAGGGRILTSDPDDMNALVADYPEVVVEPL